jgi:predicted MPP superfamily phosphohydrolase
MFGDLSSRELVLAVLLLVCDAFGLVLGARFLAGRATADRGLLRGFGLWALFGAFWATLFAAVAVLVLRNQFAVVRTVTHVLLFVMAPLSIARGIAWLRTGRRSAGLGPIAVGLGMVLVYLWAFLVEPRWVEFSTHRIETPRTAGLGAPLRVAILADIQTDAVGGYEEDVFREVAARRPDLVLLPGDFVQTYVPRRFREQAGKFRALFDLLEPWPRLGVFAVMGDIDPDPRLFDGTRVRVIDDLVVVPDGEPGLQLVGLSLAASRRPFGGALARRVEAFDGYSIVIGHAPDYAMPLLGGALRTEALCIAGHTHGGQVVVPGFGPPITLTSIPRRFAAGGMFELGAARLSVSRGVGLERGFAPRVRLFCRPEVVIVDLGPAR